MAETIGNLAYKLTVDNGQFTSGMNEVSGRIDKLATQAAGGGSAIEKAFNGIGTSANSALEAMKSGGVGGGIASVVGDVQGLVGQFAQLAGVAGTFATGFIAGLALLKSKADETAAAVNEINKLARALGETGQNTQILQQVFGSADIDAAGQTQILLRFFDRIGDLRRNLAQGNSGGAVGDTLRQIGLDPQAISRLNPEAAVEQIIVALSRVPSVYDRASASQALFGKSFADIEPIIRRGSDAFTRARQEVAAFGADASTLSAAREAQRLNRTLAAENDRQLWGPLKSGWDSALTAISLSVARFRRSVNETMSDVAEALGLRSVRQAEADAMAAAAAQAAPRLPEFDAVADRARTRTQEAEKAANKLLGEWRNVEQTMGMTSRQAAILKAQQDGVGESVLSEMRTRDIILTQMERQAQIQREIQSILAGSNAAISTFIIGIENANAVAGVQGGILSEAAQTQVLGGLFRNLERSIGLGGRENFANTGVTAGSLEAAKIIADAQTRANGGNDVQSRVLQVLEAAREIAAAQLEESRAIADALRNAPGLGIVPIRGN